MNKAELTDDLLRCSCTQSLPNSPVCSVDQMVDIECRTVATQISHKKTGENVDCSLDNGLECWPAGVKSRGACLDYEIRILCDCSTPHFQLVAVACNKIDFL